MEKVVRDKTKKHQKRTKGVESTRFEKKPVFGQIVEKLGEIYPLCASCATRKEKEEPVPRLVLLLMIQEWLDSYRDGNMPALGRVRIAGSEIMDKIREEKELQASCEEI